MSLRCGIRFGWTFADVLDDDRFKCVWNAKCTNSFIYLFFYRPLLLFVYFNHFGCQLANSTESFIWILQQTRSLKYHIADETWSLKHTRAGANFVVIILKMATHPIISIQNTFLHLTKFFFFFDFILCIFFFSYLRIAHFFGFMNDYRAD